MSVYGVISGKGGVGKSLVTTMLAVEGNRRGLTTAILDGDLTGPSIPKSFGLGEKPLMQRDGKIIPAVTKTGIQVVSVNLILEDPTEPVVWKGPILTSAIDQFWNETHWKNVDMTFVDMPPGTGDIAIKVMKDIPLKGIILVSTPQDLVTMIMKKAANLAKQLNVPILGLVENMSYFLCSDCGKKHEIFGESQVEKVAKELGIGTIAKIGLYPEIGKAIDEGRAEEIDTEEITPIVDRLVLEV
ncbi:MAG: Mrp/NBP35 family ATP-binding protein [Tissierellia bacterium]|nr:Mrp/NBP35 family ATP-binding protein [Tissierellia bacterium]